MARHTTSCKLHGKGSDIRWHLAAGGYHHSGPSAISPRRVTVTAALPGWLFAREANQVPDAHSRDGEQGASRLPVGI